MKCFKIILGAICLFILFFSVSCCKRSSPKEEISAQMKWISKYDFFDLYKKNINNGNFGPETGLKLTILKFLDEKTIFLAGSKDLHSFYNKPGQAAVLFLSTDKGKSYQEITFPEETVTFITPSEKYTLIETGSGGNSQSGKVMLYLMNNHTLEYKKIDEYSSKSKIMYSQFNGENVVYSENDNQKILNLLTKEEIELPEYLRKIPFILKKDNTVASLLKDEIQEYNLKTKEQKVIKKLKSNYDVLYYENEEYLLGKSGTFKTEMTIYNQNEGELFVENEKTIDYYRYKNFACYFKETRPYVTFYYSYNYGKVWNEYHTKDFFTTMIPKGFYKDQLIVLDVGFYNRNDNSHILVGEFQK